MSQSASSSRQVSLIGVARPAFLLLPVVCVALGTSVAWVSDAPVDPLRLLLIAVGAVAAHVAVNAFNEYTDFHSGLDAMTQRTPFSGGSGTLIQRPELANSAFRLAVTAVMVTVVCGLVLAIEAGAGLLLFGMTGLLLVLGYSGPVSRNRWWVLIAPGLGFGPLMVLGTQYALSSALSGAGVASALVVFFLTNNLLLLNQFPDRDPDRRVGRDNLAIAAPATAASCYGCFVLTAGLAIIGIALVTPLAAVALLGLWPGFGAWRAARQFDGDIPRLVPALAANVVVALATPALLTVGLALGFVLDL